MNKELVDIVMAKGDNVRISLIFAIEEAVEVFHEIGDSDLVVLDREQGRVVCVAYHEATDVVGNRLYLIEEKHYKKAKWLFKKKKTKKKTVNQTLQQSGYVRKDDGFHWEDSNQRKAS